MKKLFSFFIVLAFLCIYSYSYAQVSLYTFSQASGTYTEISGGTVVATATGTSGATSLDDVNYPGQVLPSSFIFNGISYGTFNINSNGYITFGATLPPAGTPYTPISDATAYDGAISILGRDIQGVYAVTATRTLGSMQLTAVTGFRGVIVGRVITGTGIPTGTTITAFNAVAGTIDMSAAATSNGTSTISIAAGEIRTETIGSEHIIQYKNFRKFGNTVDNFQLQIRLNLTTNVIRYVYRIDTSNATNGAPQVGLRGATNADFNNRTSTTDWTATTQGGANTATITLTTTVKPPNGHTYIWTPPANLANDVGITAINIPPDVLDLKVVTPCATVRNFGTNNQFTPFQVTMTISPGGYTSTVTDTVSAGMSNQVCFANFAPASDTQLYTITAYTRLASDQDRGNDTLRITKRFPKSNSGYDSVCQYYFANSMAPIGPPPQAQSRPKYCWKDTAGSKSLVVNAVDAAFAPRVGSLDDGYWKISLKQLLLALNQDTTAKRLKYCGVCYDSIFPGTNGVVGLTENFGAISLTDFNMDPVDCPRSALFPLWKDFRWDVLGTGAGSNRISVKAKDHQLIITYDRGAAFSDVAQWTSFQVVLEITKSCQSPNSNFRFTYTDTTTGQTSSEFVNDYFNSYNILLPNATPFFNNLVGYTGPKSLAQDAFSIYRAYMSTSNPLPGTHPIDVKRPIYHPNTRRALALEYGPDATQLNVHDCLILRTSIALEGLQRNPQPRVRDTVIVELRDCQSPPYKLIQAAKVYLSDSVVVGARRYGRVSIELSLLKRNFPYYLRIRHRNSIASWSNSITGSASDTINYDFTTALSQIFGSNGVLVHGNASFYSGDVNQDGIVDGSDLSAIDNDAFNFVTGDYVTTDLNWDGIVDGSDAAICDNNAFNFVQEVAPPGFADDDSYAILPAYDYKQPSEIIVLPDVYAQPKIDTRGQENNKKTE